MKPVMTTQEAARALHVSEMTVRKWSEQGLIRYEGKRGRYNVYNAVDVTELSVQRRQGEPDKKLRSALVVDPRGDILSDEREALRLAGITTVIAESVHHAMAMVNIPYKATTRPIVIAPTLMRSTEHELLSTYTREARIILVGDEKLMTHGAYAIMTPGGDVGALVRLVWKYVFEKRAELLGRGPDMPPGVRHGAL